HPHQYVVTFVQPPGKAPDGPQIPFEGSVGQKAFEGLTGAIERCVESGQIPRVDVKATACYWWAALHGLTSLLIAHQDFPWVDREQLITDMLAALERGLRTAPERETKAVEK